MALTVGVPKETKTAEHRVALTPDGVRELERHGVEVFVQAGAGVDSAVPDADFERAGATIVPTAVDAWSQEMVVKVKEPQGAELTYLRPDLTLFTYLHLAAYPDVAKALLALTNRIRSVPGVRSTETFIYLSLMKQTYAWGAH